MLIKGKTLQNATALKEYKIKEGDKVTPSKGGEVSGRLGVY